MNNLYLVVSKYSPVSKVVTSPKAWVKFRDAVGLTEQAITANGVKTLWYHSLPSKV